MGQIVNQISLCVKVVITLPNSTLDRTNLADILVLGEQICKIKSMGDVYNIATDGHLLAVDNNYTLDIYNMGW